MSFVGLSLRVSRGIVFRPKPFYRQSKSIQVSCRRLDNDSSNRENEAKDKLAKLLKEIKESKAKEQAATNGNIKFKFVFSFLAFH
jgi:hypothetical protein